MTYQVTQNPFNYPPLWLNEGLAVYWQEAGRDRFYSYALELAQEGNIPPLRTLNGEFAYDSEGALNAYALSLSVVIYILDTFGDEGMTNLLDVFKQGVTYDEAVEQGSGHYVRGAGCRLARLHPGKGERADGLRLDSELLRRR